MVLEGLVTENICKTYTNSSGLKFNALQNVSLTFPTQKFISIVGESGSGKSTLARIMCGLEKPDSGSLIFDGENTTNWSLGHWRKHRHKLQAVFQDATGTLNPMRSVKSNIEEAMVNLTNLSKEERLLRIKNLMELTEMDQEILKTPVRQLSGGEQRRLSLIRALSISPKYVVLDEVLSGLDLISADAVMNMLEKYHNEFKCSFLLITHNLDCAYRLSDTIVKMSSGQIVNIGKRQTKGRFPNEN